MSQVRFYNLANPRLGEAHHSKPDDHDFDTWNAQQLVDQLCWVRDLGVTEVTPPLPRLKLKLRTNGGP